MKRWSLRQLAIGAALGGLLTVSTGFQKSAAPRYITLPERTDDRPYSNAVLVGDTLYLSGAIGIDPETGKPPADVKEEVKIVMDSMKRRLEMVGMTMDDLVTVQIFCPNLELYDEFNAVYRTYFKEHFPARGFIGSGPLLANGNFEIMGVAVKR